MIEQNDDETARHVLNVRNERTTKMIDDSNRSAKTDTDTTMKRMTMIMMRDRGRDCDCDYHRGRDVIRRD